MDWSGPAASNQLNNRQCHTTLSSSSCKREEAVITSQTKATSSRAAMVPPTPKVWQMGSAVNSSSNACATNFQKTGRPGNTAAVCSVSFRGSPPGSASSHGSCLSRHGKSSAPPPLSAHGRVQWPLRLNDPFRKAVMGKGPSARRPSRASPRTSTSAPVVPPLSWKVKKLWGSRIATAPFYTPRAWIL